jgi:hypothetical protein
MWDCVAFDAAVLALVAPRFPHYFFVDAEPERVSL